MAANMDYDMHKKNVFKERYFSINSVTLVTQTKSQKCSLAVFCSFSLTGVGNHFNFERVIKI